LIGVISKTSQEEIVREFFQLFKIPWEFYSSNRSYDVVLSTRNEIPELTPKLLVIYSSETGSFDSQKGIGLGSRYRDLILERDDLEFPIYGNILTFDRLHKSVIRAKGMSGPAAIEIEEPEAKIVRIGYDLFSEVSFLLSSGQPAEYAHIPTLEIHISILRNLILDAGVPLLEIPPVPAGYDFITCLTHDVDFAGIRNHKFDHTMFGFIYRALLGSVIDVLKGRTSWNRLSKNWKAVLLLPCVYLGIVKDFWAQFERYIELEKGLGSTFFLIPFKNQAGLNVSEQARKRRAARYDVCDIEPDVRRLISCGCEVGLHGIDAWQDSEKGRKEFERIFDVVGESNIGIRMHWLYFCNHSPRLLETAGFSYDSTFGYNDAIGYRGGTVQVFRPLGAKKLLELSLHIQDTALFYPDRMGLTDSKADELVNQLLKNTTMFGGVLAINWHQRSLGPERLWDDFYITLLGKLKALNVWFSTASDAVEWFNKRRAVSFQDAEFNGNTVKLRLGGYNPDHRPGLLVRIYKPDAAFKDVALSGINKSAGAENSALKVRRDGSFWRINPV
jgi:hypothetical protein